MDYGSLYGMGSYFGEDYTAANLVRLATLTEGNIAKAKTGKALSDLTAESKPRSRRRCRSSFRVSI